MTLQSSGTISLANLRDEYNNGSSDPIVLNDYYRGGSLVRANADNNTATNLSADIPTSANSSPLSINDFYGQARAFRKTYSSTATDQSGVGVFGDDFAVNYPKEIVINASQTVGATSSSAPALKIDSTGAGTITITNNGSIEGAGGAASSAGGNALQVDGSVSVTLVNNGTIKAGGGGGGTGGTGGTGDVDATASEIATNVTGIEPEEEEEESSTPEIDPKVTSELGLGVRANPELTRPKNSKGDLLPQFGSSGYFDAIVSIGEGGKNVEANYGVSNLSDFLSLYAQNPQFDQTKFETNFKIEQKADIEKANPFKASLKKQAPPMAMTMNRPPNMGVGQQQPVVTGAGTMKNTEKAVAANKPAATPAKTKARRRKPKTIEMMVKSIANRVG